MEEEIVSVLKMLVEKVQDLERKLYESETTLIKSGFVASTPTPSSKPSRGMPSNSQIQNMDWDDIHDFVAKMEGTQWTTKNQNLAYTLN